MADDPYARIAELEAELRQRDSAFAEALEQQTATAEVLRVIASSPNDLQIVLDTIIESASRVSRSSSSALVLPDGEHLQVVASHGMLANVRHGAIATIHQRRTAARAFVERRTIHISDYSDPVVLAEFPDNEFARQMAGVTVPLLREGGAVSVLNVRRDRAESYSDGEIALLETFADQAVIAIENARLFEELEQRNTALHESNRQVTEALDQQTVLAEVLRVIASSPTDPQRVLDTIAETAARLCDEDVAAIQESEAGLLQVRAVYGWRGSESVAEWVRERARAGQFATPFTRVSGAGTALLDRRTVHVPDTNVTEKTFPEVYTSSRQTGTGSLASTPLLHGDEAIGVLALFNIGEPRPFTEQQLSLLETFASQAAIAIANARLFGELQQRNQEHNESNR
jgi:two-component system, NtrC family, sensor kinase